MQSRYAGDIGDFGKFALLRALCPNRRIGIIWYLTSELNEKNNDGIHLKFLGKPERFKELDCVVFDALNSFQAEFEKDSNARSIKRLEQRGFLSNACYFSHEVPVDRWRRTEWFKKILQSEIVQSDILFLDPDNGIEGRRLTNKHVALAELAQLRNVRKPMIIYHHQSRIRGGAPVEAAMLFEKVRSIGCDPVEIVRLRPYSSRFYVIAEHDDAISASLSTFVSRWQGLIEVYKNPLS
ncbi:MAG: hypothetical protein ACRECE_04970 [Xanthobacteraceae bacterium]